MDIQSSSLSIVQDKCVIPDLAWTRYLAKPIDTNQLFLRNDGLLGGVNPEKDVVVDEDNVTITLAIIACRTVMQVIGRKERIRNRGHPARYHHPQLHFIRQQ